MPRLAILFLLLLAGSAVADTAPATLTWDRNQEPDVNRYEVQIGTAPGVHDHLYHVTDGTVQQTVTLDIGTYYYAVVVAIDTSGQRSGPSNELCFRVYKPGQGVPPAPPTGLRKMNVLVSLQSSPDLRIWSIQSEQLVEIAAEQMFWRLQLSN